MESNYSNYGNYGNTTTTSYSAAGGAGGGGFLSGGSQNSPSGGSRARNETLRPVTIKQILEAESADNTAFKIDNNPAEHVTVVGQVRNISQQTTNITYRIDDGTGVMEVKFWIDPERVENDDKPAINENSYVRTLGTLKAFNNKRWINTRVIRPISDINEINYHLLEATAVHLFFTRGAPGEQKAGGTGANGMGVNGMHSMSAALPAHLSAEAKKVYHVLLSTESGNEGLHVHDIADRARMEIGEVAKVGDELLSQGLIYTTVDDQTWQLLDKTGYE